MTFVLFYHSLVSDWNHGNAHFLRGIVSELMHRGFEVRVLEPRRGWSRRNLLQDHGRKALREFRRAFPRLRSTLYDPGRLDLDAALEGADFVLVHEWTDPALVRRIGRHRRAGGRYRLFFHDTHHRMASAAAAFKDHGLDAYDGILAYGESLRLMYETAGWSRRVWTWHEAADTTLFRPPRQPAGRRGDLVWVGNWGDGERSAELRELLLRPIRELGLRARLYGVRYPARALAAVRASGAIYGGWLANHEVPAAFARHAATVHVPRRPYLDRLPGIPTIRVFEALACGIPLICARWRDAEGLFGKEDFLTADSGEQVRRQLRDLLADPARAGALAANGLATIRARHTCGHRVDELLAICRAVGLPADRPARTGALEAMP